MISSWQLENRVEFWIGEITGNDFPISGVINASADQRVRIDKAEIILIRFLRLKNNFGQICCTSDD